MIVYSPMKSGLLTGKMTKERVAALPEDDFRQRALAFQEPQLTRNLALAELMKEIGARHGRTAGEVAIAWTLRHPAVTAAIVGMRSAEQADGVIGAMEFRLTLERLPRSTWRGGRRKRRPRGPDQIGPAACPAQERSQFRPVGRLPIVMGDARR